MKVAEAIAEQEQTDGRRLYLIQQGLFFHAFNACAAFLQNITGYRIRAVPLAGHTVHQLGIPCSAIDGVLQRLKQAHPEVEISTDDTGKHYVLALPEELAEQTVTSVQPLPSPPSPTPAHDVHRSRTEAEHDVCVLVSMIDVEHATLDDLRRYIRILQRHLSMSRHVGMSDEKP